MSWIGIVIVLVLVLAALVFVRTALKPVALMPEITPESEVNGCAVLLCYRESAATDKTSLEQAWAKSRAQLIEENRDSLAYQSYAQVHRVSRWHIVSLLLQLSRSWPIVALGSFFRGLPITSPRFLYAQRKLEAWDMLEIFNFKNPQAALRFLNDNELTSVRKLLNEDAEKWTSYRQAVPMQITTALDHRLAKDGGLLNLFFLRARDHLGRQAMLDFWLLKHKPFALQQQPVLQYDVYHQYIAKETEQLEAAASSLSSGGTLVPNNAWDGVASVGFTGMAQLLRGIINPRIQVANFRLVFDEIRFIDIKRSSLVLGNVRHYHS